MLRPVSLVVLFAATAAAVAQDAPPPRPAAPKAGPVGVWEGPLKVGPIELRLAITVTKGEGDALSAKLYSIDQGPGAVPADAVAFADKTLTVELPKIKAKYVGTMAADGQSLAGKWEQSGQKLPLTLKRVEKMSTLNRPQTPKPPFPYPAEDVTFENPAAKIKLAGTLTLPKGDGPFPAAVMVSGSGPQDRDETLFGHKPFLLIADHLARNGVAVLRYDDRGVGKSQGKQQGATSADFATDAHAAVKYLLGRKEIDPKRVGIIGHSEGGVIAPLVAAAHPDDVGFIVLLAGPGVPGDAISRGQSAAMARAAGETPEGVKVAGKLLDAMLTATMADGPAEGRKERVKAALTAAVDALPDAQRKLLGDQAGAEAAEAAAARLTDPWLMWFLKYDPRPTLGKVKCPVLAVNGELDLQVLHKDNVPEIVKAVQAGGNEKVTAKVFPGLNHLFQPTKTGAVGEYGQIEQTIAPEVLGFVTEWLKGLK